MLNLITTISVGCFDILGIPGKTRISEDSDGTLIVEHRVTNNYMANTMTYYFTTPQEADSIIQHLKNNVLKTPTITIYKEHTNIIQKIL